MMLNDLQCPAGYFCPAGLSDVANADDCSVAKYCPQGTILKYIYDLCITAIRCSLSEKM